MYAVPPLRLAAPRERLLAPPPPRRHAVRRSARRRLSCVRSHARTLAHSRSEMGVPCRVRESELPTCRPRVDTMLENLSMHIADNRHVVLRGKNQSLRRKRQQRQQRQRQSTALTSRSESEISATSCTVLRRHASHVSLVRSSGRSRRVEFSSDNARKYRSGRGRRPRVEKRDGRRATRLCPASLYSLTRVRVHREYGSRLLAHSQWQRPRQCSHRLLSHTHAPVVSRCRRLRPTTRVDRGSVVADVMRAMHR